MNSNKSYQTVVSLAQMLNQINSNLPQDPENQLLFLGDLEQFIEIDDNFKFIPRIENPNQQQVIEKQTFNKNKMEKTKIRIGTKTVAKYQKESDINQAIIAINGKLREAIESIGFEFTNETVADCINGGRNISNQYHEKLNKELSSFTIPSSKELFEKSAIEGLRNFHEIRKQVTGKCGSTTMKYITINNDYAEFTEDSKCQLDEDYGIYLEDPKEIELYELHLRACEALNGLFQGFSSMNWTQVFDFENGRFIPNQFTSYDVILNNINKAENEK